MKVTTHAKLLKHRLSRSTPSKVALGAAAASGIAGYGYYLFKKVKGDMEKAAVRAKDAAKESAV